MKKEKLINIANAFKFILDNNFTRITRGVKKWKRLGDFRAWYVWDMFHNDLGDFVISFLQIGDTAVAVYNVTTGELVMFEDISSSIIDAWEDVFNGVR